MMTTRSTTTMGALPLQRPGPASAASPCTRPASGRSQTRSRPRLPGTAARTPRTASAQPSTRPPTVGRPSICSSRTSTTAPTSTPNDIDCALGDLDLCIALLEGASCHIWRAADGGASWTEVYSGDATCSVVNARFVSPAEVWVTGGLGLSTQDQSGAFWHSTDAGKTFEVETVPGLYIMDLDIPAPGVGFASAITPMQTCELLRLRNATLPVEVERAQRV